MIYFGSCQCHFPERNKTLQLQGEIATKRMIQFRWISSCGNDWFVFWPWHEAANWILPSEHTAANLYSPKDKRKQWTYRKRLCLGVLYTVNRKQLTELGAESADLLFIPSPLFVSLLPSPLPLPVLFFFFTLWGNKARNDWTSSEAQPTFGLNARILP